jgi:hypothetical protein
MTVLFVGLDVHKDTIAVTVAEEERDGEVVPAARLKAAWFK